MIYISILNLYINIISKKSDFYGYSNENVKIHTIFNEYTYNIYTTDFYNPYDSINFDYIQIEFVKF